MAARRRREPMGTPVWRSWRSLRGVETVLGSRVGGGGRGGLDVGSRASSFRWMLVVKLEVEGMAPGPRLVRLRRLRNAGRMVEAGAAMMEDCMN